jgi:hypothetical protein
LACRLKGTDDVTADHCLKQFSAVRAILILGLADWKVKMRVKFAAWYGIVVGALMLVQWSFFLATGNVPELETEPFRIWFHLVGEFATALGLVASGVALLRSLAWGRTLYLVMVGMAIYSEIVSPGYFAQQGQWALVVMFAVLLVGAVSSVVAVAKSDRFGTGKE